MTPDPDSRQAFPRPLSDAPNHAYNGDGAHNGNGAQDALLQCFADDVGADAACLLVREGLRGPTRLISNWDPDGHGWPHRWRDGEFVTRLLEGDEPILESANGVAAEPAIPVTENRVSIEHALGAVAPSPDGVEAIVCAGFAREPLPGRDQLLWAAGSFATAAALCLADAGGLGEALSSFRRDSLTGCLSYAGLVEILAQEINRSTRNHNPLSCCFLDLDGFKHVNTVVGHLEGNRMLAAIGASLRDSVRSYDFVGRFGGDEFVIILPGTGTRSAHETAERLRDRLRKTTPVATEARVEVSIGTAEWSAGMSAEDLLESADRSLRVAKDSGGSTVVSAPSPDPLAESILGIFQSLTDLMGKADQPKASRDPKTSQEPKS